MALQKIHKNGIKNKCILLQKSQKSTYSGIFKKFMENAYYEKLHGLKNFLHQNKLMF